MAVSYQQYTFPPINATSSSPSTAPTGTPVPADATLVGGKDGSGLLQPVSVDSAGVLNVNLSSSLVPTSYDEVDLTYVAAGNGVGQVQTATYKLVGVTVKTLTLNYNASNQLTSVVAS